MSFTYLGGLPVGQPGQKVGVELVDGGICLRQAGALRRWRYDLPFQRLHSVRGDGSRVEIDTTAGGQAAVIVLEGRDAAALRREIAGAMAYMQAARDFANEIEHSHAEVS